MSVSNKDIALSIIDYLKKSVSDKVIAEDYAESMDVAIDCIADAFEVSKDDSVSSKFQGKDLSTLITSALSQKSESSASTKTETPVAAAPVEASAADQENADKLKLEGNRAMANKDFPEAITKYTEAIKLNPANVVYLSNRAAAFSQAGQHDKAVLDSESAIKLNPKFSKAYSRLGLAKYALGDAKGAMEAYKQGLDIEGDSKSDAMTRGYETAKRRVEEDLASSMPLTQLTEDSAKSAGAASGAAAGAAAGGMPDFSSMFGGAGGMPNIAEMMNNPQVMQAAQKLMSDPSALAGLMNNPMMKNMAQNMGMGGEDGAAPDFSELMNNPMLKNMANQFMGGQNPGSGSGSGSN